MDFITELQQSMIQQLPELLSQYEGDLSATSLSEMETSVKQMTHELGNAIMRQWLEAQAQKYPEVGGFCKLPRKRPFSSK